VFRNARGIGVHAKAGSPSLLERPGFSDCQRQFRCGVLFRTADAAGKWVAQVSTPIFEESIAWRDGLK